MLNAKKDIRSFRLALSTPLGPKRGRGRSSAIDSVLASVEGFYGEVLQYLKAWAAAPPKMREVDEHPAEQPPVLASTALSSQDGIETASEPVVHPSDPALEQMPPSVITE